MANEVHVQVLLSGLKQWEFARSQREHTVPDLSRANLSGANLRGFDLRGTNLNGANLSGADLEGAILAGGYFHIGRGMGADLSGANLSGANLKGATVGSHNPFADDHGKGSGANFSGCDLRGADLSTVTGLTADQIAVAVVDESTKLPVYLNFSVEVDAHADDVIARNMNERLSDSRVQTGRFMTADYVRNLMAERGAREVAAFESRLAEEIEQTEKAILEEATKNRGLWVQGPSHGEIYLDMIPGREMREELFPPALKAYIQHFRSEGFTVTPIVYRKGSSWFRFEIRW
jgi:hypothetical protein